MLFLFPGEAMADKNQGADSIRSIHIAFKRLKSQLHKEIYFN